MASIHASRCFGTSLAAVFTRRDVRTRLMLDAAVATTALIL